MHNLHLVLGPNQWTGPASVASDRPLEVQIAATGEACGGWVPVTFGWVYGPGDDEISPARGVRVIVDALNRPG
jgi:hypothetical protein